MQKLLTIFVICYIVIQPAMAVKCTGLNDILAEYCDAEGYKYDTGTDAYGHYSEYNDSIKIGCYKFKKTNHKKMTTAVAKACNISESNVTIQTDLKRDKDQVQCKDIDKKNGITELQYIDGVCAPTKCLTPRWELSGKGKRAKCQEQECEFEHGTGKWEQNGDTWECKLKTCDKDYDHNTEKNECTKPGEPDTDDGDDQTQQNEPRLSESESQSRVDELKDNAKKMREKEQSTENKMLGAAGIGATGIGGMQMASAMAEQRVDEDAEAAMRAYLATFRCNYGDGKNIAGGERDIELPGGNELVNLYSEYVNLANDLKVRKNALDMRPGIESESILDAATSGLYDDVSVGKTTGAFTSLARALMDPNGADAAAWAAQREETASKKKTGMITAGIGAVGSLAGNLILNSGDDDKNKVDDILDKYEKKEESVVRDDSENLVLRNSNDETVSVEREKKQEESGLKKVVAKVTSGRTEESDIETVLRSGNMTSEWTKVSGEDMFDTRGLSLAGKKKIDSVWGTPGDQVCLFEAYLVESKSGSMTAKQKAMEKYLVGKQKNSKSQIDLIVRSYNVGGCKEEEVPCPYVLMKSGCIDSGDIAGGEQGQTEWVELAKPSKHFDILIDGTIYQSKTRGKYSDYLAKAEKACGDASGTWHDEIRVYTGMENKDGKYNTYVDATCDFGKDDKSPRSTRCSDMCKNSGINCKNSGGLGTDYYTSCFILPPSE